ncbi:MAG: hypothetical protein RLZZ584_836 [Pseudomonadota bacterium]
MGLYPSRLAALLAMPVRPGHASGGPHGQGSQAMQGYRAVQLTLWITAAMLVLLTWLHIAQLVNDSRARELAAATRDLANITRVTEEHAERTLQGADQVIRFVQERFLVEGKRLDLVALTERGVIDAQNFNQVGVIDARGIYLLSNQPGFTRMDLSDREHFRVHLSGDTGTLFVSRPVVGRATGKWSIQLTRRITRADGSFAGVVVVSMDPAYFGGFYSDLNLGAQGIAALYGMDGTARARRVGARVEFGADARASRMYPRIAAGQLHGSYMDASVVDQVERILHYRKLPHYPLVVAGQAVGDVLANHRRTRDALLLQGGLVSALILALAAALTRHLRQIRRDVAARQTAQQQLRDRTEQLDAIFEMSPDGFVGFDRQGLLKYVNPAFLRMTHASAASLLGLTDAAFTRWLDSICLPGAGLPGLGALKQPSGAVAVAARRDCITIVGHGNRILQVGLRESEASSIARILYFRDVTHETEVDQIKSEFLSTAAHELRTPMASILGFSEVLLGDGIGSADQQEFLGVIHEQSRNMARILDELLDLARMEARRGKDFKLAALNLNQLVEDVVKACKVPAGRALPEVDLPCEPLQLVADIGKLRQALLNVLSNAYKYSPAGGAVQVQVERVPAMADRPACAAMCITDHGIGMTADQVHHVCERFYRADKSGKLPGTGLGMSIVKEIIELHGGTLEITSAVGRGSCISLYVPLEAPGAAADAAVTSAMAHPGAAPDSRSGGHLPA